MIRRPATSSIRPAHQYGQCPVGRSVLTGQPNSFEVPCTQYSSPNTTRKTLSTVGVWSVSRASRSAGMSRAYRCRGVAGSALQQDRHGTVVDRLHLHVGAESAGG